LVSISKRYQIETFEALFPDNAKNEGNNTACYFYHTLQDSLPHLNLKVTYINTTLNRNLLATSNFLKLQIIQRLKVITSLGENAVLLEQ
jgi:hypothetical protein